MESVYTQTKKKKESAIRKIYDCWVGIQKASKLIFKKAPLFYELPIHVINSRARADDWLI